MSRHESLYWNQWFGFQVMAGEISKPLQVGTAYRAPPPLIKTRLGTVARLCADLNHLPAACPSIVNASAMIRVLKSPVNLLVI